MVQKKLPLINSAHGSETRNIINELIKLFNGMGYTYDDALQKAHNVLSEAKKTNDTNKNVQQQINTLIAESGTSDSEVVQARVDADGQAHSVLKERLDKSDNELSENKQNAFNAKVNNKSKKAIVTFIDDDGRVEVMTKLKPVMEAEGVPATLSILDGYIGVQGFMNEEQIKSLADLGWEIASHTVNSVDLKQADYETKKFEIFESKKRLEARGFEVHNLVYPYGEQDYDTRNLLREAGYNCAATVRHGVNTTPISRYQLNRYPINNDRNLDDYKSYVDEAIENDGWLIFTLHVEHNDPIQANYIRDTIRYCKANGVEILNMNDALKQFDNLTDAGDEDGDGYTRISADGSIESTYLTDLYSREVVTSSTPLTDFQLDKVTKNAVQSADATGFPENKGGTLITSVLSGWSWGFQYYYPVNSEKVYRRLWDRIPAVWTEWKKISLNDELKILDLNSIPFNYNPINLKENLTHVAHNSSAATGFPSNASGTRTINKVGPSSGWWHELFYQYNSNRIFIRGTKSDGTFHEFDELARKKETTTSTIDFGLIPAQTTRDFVTEVSAETLDLPIVHSATVLPIGMMMTAYINTGRKVVIRLANVTANEISVGQIGFIRISVIKS